MAAAIRSAAAKPWRDAGNMFRMSADVAHVCLIVVLLHG